MTRSRSKNPLVGAAVLATVVVSAGYYLYTKSIASSKAWVKPKKKERNRSERISIVLSQSLIDQRFPLAPLVDKFSELVIILGPDANSKIELVQRQIPAESQHKIIPCETQIGVVHVLKHLRSDLVVLPNDIPQTVPSDISRFVGTVHVLDNNSEDVKNQLDELFF
jgi:hypothetical protein